MKIAILAAFAALILGAAATQAADYRAPTHNFYQNNWMSSHS